MPPIQSTRLLPVYARGAHVKRRLACKKKKKKKEKKKKKTKKERNGTAADATAEKRALLYVVRTYVHGEKRAHVRSNYTRGRKVEREGKIQVDRTEIRIEKCESTGVAGIRRVKTYPCARTRVYARARARVKEKERSALNVGGACAPTTSQR